MFETRIGPDRLRQRDVPRCLWLYRLKELLWDYDPESLETLSCLVKLAFGAWLVGPGIRAFHPPGSELPLIAQVAPESTWGVTLIALGLLQFIALFTGAVQTRRWIALLNCFAWAFVATVFMFVDPKISAVPFAGCLAFGQAWVYLVLGIRGRAGGG